MTSRCNSPATTISPPKESVATRDGQRTEVQRGDIRLFVAFRPGENVSNEVSFTGGYPFREGSPVTLAVGADNFTLTPGAGDRITRIDAILNGTTNSNATLSAIVINGPVDDALWKRKGATP